MSTARTIYAPATAPGKGAVAIIRVSGPLAPSIPARLGFPGSMSPRKAHYARFLHPVNGDALDDGLIVYFPAPNSFTGEAVVEFQCHGGRAVVARLLDALGTIPGLTLAEPGEFTRQAFYNGKLDLTQAEAIADLIEADTEAKRRQALWQLHGGIRGKLEAWRHDLLENLAYLEAFIDFPDEDIPADIFARIQDGVATLAHTFEQHLRSHRGELIRAGVRVVILGPPNAGKSSLMNLLSKREVAIVSHIAGTTRDVIEVHLDMNGYEFILVDTAGIRETGDAIEREGVRRSLSQAEQADIRVVVLDAAAPVIPLELTELLDERTIIAINKCDQGTPVVDAQLKNVRPVFISVTEQTNISALLERMYALAEIGGADSDSVITTVRHRQCLAEAHEFLKKFLSGGPIELICEDLRLAIRALGRIAGVVDVEDVLDVIFSSFCIGK